MRRGRRRHNRVSGIVCLIVVAVVAFAVFSTIAERNGEGFSLSGISFPSIGEIFGAQPPEQPATPSASEGTVEVHFIDVGQGNAILIIAPEGTALIDGGDNGQGANVLRYLAEQGVSAIDIMIATHPHADHIGGLIDVVRELEVGTVIMPELPENLVPTTRTYTNLLMALLENDLGITPAAPGDVYHLGGGATLSILGPVREYSAVNDMSVVSRLEFGQTSFLFTGDIERAAEHDLAAEGGVRSDLLNVAHHGSRTSSTQVFLDAVAPSIAVISVGLDNSYGHPRREVIERLEDMNVQILRTDFDGSVVVVSDGSGLSIVTER